MRADKFRIPAALAVLIIWIAITAFWGVWLPHGQHSLAAGVINSVSPNLLYATIFIALAVIAFRWWDVAFTWPERPREIMLVWFPLIYIMAFFSLTLITGLPSPQVIGFVAINTILVGFSEEMAFRGVLFRALLTRMPIWPAIIVTTVLFGSVHSLNALTTGDLPAALTQSVTAAMSGLLFIAIVLRTGSIIPAMVLHALWDFSNLLGIVNLLESAPTQPINSFALLIPVLVQIPTFAYALFLLRKIGHAPTPQPLPPDYFQRP